MANDVKAFFHEWCSKAKLDPAFESRATGEYVYKIDNFHVIVTNTNQWL